MKGVIIYQGKYGATEQYAQWLAEALQLPALRAKSVDAELLANYDTVIMGGSVYMGKLTIRKWLRQNIYPLHKKKLFLFVVCGTTNDDQNEQRKIIETNIAPPTRQAAETFFLPGRCVVDKLFFKDCLILKMRALLLKDPGLKAMMSQGFDRMNKQSLDELIAAIRRYDSRSNDPVLPNRSHLTDV